MAVILVVGVEAIEEWVQPVLVGGVHVDIVAGGAVGDRAARWETNVAGARGVANAVTMPALQPAAAHAGVMLNRHEKNSSRTCRY